MPGVAPGEIIVLDLPAYVANSELTETIGFVCRIVTAGSVDGLVDLAKTAHGEDQLGLLDSEAHAGQSISVRVLGTALGVIGAAVARGDPLTCDTNGRLVTATSGERAIARALETGTLSATPTGFEAISVLLTGPFNVP